MLAESMNIKLRAAKQNESLLIKKLIEKAGIFADIKNLKVSDIEDGHMGSLMLFMNGEYTKREATVYVSECQFNDADGISVVATLYSDANGILSELDIWKVDFQPLISLPESFD